MGKTLKVNLSANTNPQPSAASEILIFRATLSVKLRNKSVKMKILEIFPDLSEVQLKSKAKTKKASNS